MADNHEKFREAVRTLLEKDPRIEVVGEAGDGIEALELACSVKPDVVVMDMRMPKFNGVAALRQITAFNPRIKVIIFSANAVQVYAETMLAAGARGYVVKSDAKELPRAIHAVMLDLVYLSSELRQPDADKVGWAAAINDLAMAAGNNL